MIEYDNQNWEAVFRITGSVLPGALPVGICCFCVGLGATLLRVHTTVLDDSGGVLVGHDVEYKIEHEFALKTLAVTIGILLSVRTNMALNRWMDGISQIQLMLSKWGDAFICLSGFFTARVNTPEAEERILFFRIRMAHWFSLMSCLAFATVRARTLPDMSEIPVVELFDPTHRAISFTSPRDQGMGAPVSTQMANANNDQDEMRDLDGLTLMVLAAPTVEEIELLELSNDKVNTVYYWIIEAVIEEIRAKTLDAPAPIVSRVLQEVSNGKVGFIQAHKVAMVPFPFPFAQIVSSLLAMVYVLFPFYIDIFTLNVFFSPFLCLLIPICYCGLNQVAVELEEPFGTDWNDVDIEVRHEEFLMMLIDVLRSPTTAPAATPGLKQEKKILEGISEADGSDPLVGGRSRFTLNPQIAKSLSNLSNLSTHDEADEKQT